LKTVIFDTWAASAIWAIETSSKPWERNSRRAAAAI
jgi:hypothetical protein